LIFHGEIDMTRMTIWFLALLFACGSALAEPPKDYPFLSFDRGLRLAQEQHKPVFVYFGRFGCAWCDQVN
jgi:thioredoxin-related protein